MAATKELTATLVGTGDFENDGTWSVKSGTETIVTIAPKTGLKCTVSAAGEGEDAVIFTAKGFPSVTAECPVTVTKIVPDPTVTGASIAPPSVNDLEIG